MPQDSGPSERRAIEFRRSSRWLAVLILTVYGALLFAASDRLTIFEDEAFIIIMAGRNAPSQTIDGFFHGNVLHEHPPLYDLFLSVWLSLTDAKQELLRLPSVVFYCLAVWFIGASAQILWGRRLLGILLGVAWPAAFLLGPPAHWSAFAMLGIAGMTYGYLRWRHSQRTGDLLVFSCFTLVLCYTNYLGLAFVGVLGLHFLLSRPPAAAIRQAAGVALLTLLALLPLLQVFLRILVGRASAPRSLTRVAAEGVYYAWAIPVSEALAPWHAPALLALVGLGLLTWLAVRTREPLWILGLLASVYAAALSVGALNGRYLGLYGPWMLLYLTGLLAHTHRRRTALVGLLLVFGSGWLGVITQKWPATLRYQEPWQEVTAAALDLSGPGSLILCNHPSVYLYAYYQLGEKDWPNYLRPWFPRGGRIFAQAPEWREVVKDAERIVHVRSVAVKDGEREFEAYLAEHYRLLESLRCLEDDAAPLKQRFLTNQLNVRIEIRAYERLTESGAS